MWEILAAFLKIGTTAYGGPAIQGVMQAEFQERRQWLTKSEFVEGLAFVNMPLGLCRAAYPRCRRGNPGSPARHGRSSAPLHAWLARRQYRLDRKT
jgi:hypothetical protein